jgi:hypothetical protein
MIMMFGKFILNDVLFFNSFKNLELEVFLFWFFSKIQSAH